MADPREIARKITLIVDQHIAGMSAVMRAEKWPPQLQAVMYRAVAIRATALAEQAEREGKDHG